MEGKPIKIFYETKIPYFIFVIPAVLACLIGLLVTGGDVMMNIFTYLLGISAIALIFLCFYQGSKFYIYEDKLIWKKGFHEMEAPWNQVKGIHYDYAPNVWYARRNFKSNNFFLEMNQGYTQYANEWNIREGHFTFRSRSKELIEEIKRRAGVSEDVGAVSAFKQRQNLWGIILLVGAILVIGLGGILYATYFGP